MKITYFMTGIGLTGGPMTLYNFMNGLVKKGHEVHLVTMYDGFKWDNDTYKNYIDKHYPEQERSIFYNKIRFYLNKLISYSGSDFRLGKDKVLSITEAFTKHYRQLGIDSDILIASAPLTGDAVYKLGIGKRIVMHNQHFEVITTDIKDVQDGYELITRLPFNHIVNCTWLDKMFRYNYRIQGKIITPGMNHEIFHPGENTDKYQKMNPAKLLTYCDPRRKFKGTTEQIKILSAVYKKNPEVKIFIYGMDPKTEEFPYTFLGWITQEQLATYYAQCHLLVSFSWYESFPLPPIEAMACNCCVVAGKYGTEDYLIDGKTGLVINPFNIEQSANKILDLLSNPRKMSELALRGEAMAKTFTWEAQVEKLTDFLIHLPAPRSMPISEIQNGNLEAIEVIYK